MANGVSTRVVNFPAPSSISPAAQAALSYPIPKNLPFPDIYDREAWMDLIYERNETYGAIFAKAGENWPCVRRSVIASVPVAMVARPKDAAGQDYIYLDIHGGGLIFFGGKYLDDFAAMTAMAVKAEVVSVDYRMPPDHPFPAALDDCLAVYLALLDEWGTERIIVGGASAGGNLATALMLRLKALGAAHPAGLLLLSPEVDLTESGDSFQVLNGVDVLTSMMAANRLYAAGMPLAHPLVSPLFGDFAGGFPRTFIQSGTRDILLSNAVRLHRTLLKEKVPAELHIWEAMPHGRFFGAPEDLEVEQAMRDFIATCISN